MKDFLFKKNIIFVILFLAIVGGLFYFFTKDSDPKQNYEVAVVIREKNKKDPGEAARALKYGDVLLVQKEGHNWSSTERISYLILKMSLSESEKQKLTEAVEKNLTKEEIQNELNKLKERNEDMDKEELGQYKEELENRAEIIRARKYGINMEKYFGDFRPTDLIKGQHYQKEIYDWEIILKK